MNAKFNFEDVSSDYQSYSNETYSKASLKWRLKKKTKNWFQNRIYLNAGKEVLQNAPWGAFCNTFDLY